MKTKTEKNLSIAIIIFMVLIIVAYVIVIIEFSKQKKFIFKPFVPPKDDKYFNPTGDIIQLTPDEIIKRKVIIKNALDNLPKSS